MKKETLDRPTSPGLGAAENCGQYVNEQFENLIKIGVFKELHNRRLLSDFQLDAALRLLDQKAK